jgi:RNA polymerase sigma-70 factor (ECF subfamily)
MKVRIAIAKEIAAPSPRPADPIDALYERHLGQVKRWARQLSGPGVDLEDLVHDVFCIAFRKGFRDRGEASVDTWLFRITHHEVRARRRRSRLRQMLLGRHQDRLVPVAPDTPQEELERREQHARLYRALDRLPDRYRTALILFEIEELSGEQVAEITETSEAAVWVRLHRGRAKLIELLQENGQA